MRIGRWSRYTWIRQGVDRRNIQRKLCILFCANFGCNLVRRRWSTRCKRRNCISQLLLRTCYGDKRVWLEDWRLWIPAVLCLWREIDLETIYNETLDESRVSSYNKVVIWKNDDEDSRIYRKGKANQGWWEPDASSVYLNITSELQQWTDL